MYAIKAQVSNLKSPSFGIILILFILLVIATTFLYSSAREDAQPDDGLTTLELSRGFNIYNRTSNFSLVTTSLEGEFADQFPPSHVILPYQEFHFEVKAYNSSAYVTYNVVSGGNTVGDIRINMRTTSPAPVKPKTIIDFINGPIRYENGGTYVTIFNL
ncbi:hypothetical protein M3223_16645 [Paenibacillus pasadenensis]|uniref:hypothetical protein n=1 Tax=Paenibacillus pasadenensis TaxID=217090 RepID=UPI00203B98CC|nr:hypothetical protein [Paenibacillus pasadenensis]MCM3748986.1 hypothetical protein [Paenibacillus pasadenensis]